MQETEENRSIQLLRKNLPSKRAFEQELVTLQIQVSRGVGECRGGEGDKGEVL